LLTKLTKKHKIPPCLAKPFTANNPLPKVWLLNLWFHPPEFYTFTCLANIRSAHLF
jgi:hypothetical protein